MADESDRGLVVASQAGDAQAFAVLVERHYGMVRSLAFSRTDDWAAAEDVAQDVFLVAWTKLSGLRHPEAFLMWLRRIARNAALNWVRKGAYRRQLTERNRFRRGEAAGEMEDPAACAARAECLDRIGEALRSLSPKLREAMVLFYIEGQTVAESAGALGIRDDAMKKRLRLGRQGLQRYFQRKAEYDLEQLLPHKPKRQIDNILAGLALGPVLPDLASASADLGLGLCIHDLVHGASPSFWKGAGLRIAGIPVAALPAVAGAIVIGLIAVGAAAVLVVEPTDSPESSAVSAVAEDEEPLDSPGFIASEAAVLSDERAGDGGQRYLLVQNLYPDAMPSGKGLQRGDRIVRVNGVPVSATLLEDPRGYFYGLPGTAVQVTVLRHDEEAGEEREVTLDLLRPYFPRQYGDGG